MHLPKGNLQVSMSIQYYSRQTTIAETVAFLHRDVDVFLVQIR